MCEKKDYRPYSTQNNDIPPETILKHVLIENGKLKSEVAYLEDCLQKKEEAIKAFKEWQRQAAKWNYAYWLTEGLRLIDEQPEDEKYRHLRSILGTFELFRATLRSMEKTYQRIQESRHFLTDIYKGKIKLEDELQGTDDGLDAEASRSDT